MSRSGVNCIGTCSVAQDTLSRLTCRSEDLTLGQPVLTRLADYDALYRQFRWPTPATYNIGVEVCDRWADLDPSRTALIDTRDGGHCAEVSYGALREKSNRLANVLRTFGVMRGDRVAILLPQGPDVAVSHIAIYKLAAIAVPLAMQFG